jgi:hypothetical protein
VPKKIVILEDNAERQAAMRQALADRLHTFEPVFFASTAPLLDYLGRHLEEAILIALDHDLEMLPGRNGRCTDAGCGREVADFLAQQSPACPVVLHTTNGAAGDGMAMVLNDAGWKTYRVVPAGDLEWVGTAWIRTLRRAILGTAKDRAPAS